MRPTTSLANSCCCSIAALSNGWSTWTSYGKNFYLVDDNFPQTFSVNTDSLCLFSDRFPWIHANTSFVFSTFLGVETVVNVVVHVVANTYGVLEFLN
ncbi:hypothetical protein NPIL_217161 [Nephila pilipes]|uniref:Uncharacterized protein n=1 Tax=Nephila pilipes TaxID=299642 RepID=A0A8X6Q7M3_NEPPI|nr:hypothetical protein NPIL_217161 [Nephila pilipes]